MIIKKLTASNNIFQNFTFISHSQESIQSHPIQRQNLISGLKFKDNQISQPDHILMIELQTPIPLSLVNIQISNITSLNARKTDYISDVRFFSLYSTYKVIDKLSYIMRRSPGHKPVRKILNGGNNDDSTTSEEYFHCDYGYNKDGSCWTPIFGVVHVCYDNTTYEEI